MNVCVWLSAKQVYAKVVLLEIVNLSVILIFSNYA